jgi:hypothetical protein
MSIVKKNFIKMTLLLILLLEFNNKIVLTILNLLNLFSFEANNYLTTVYLVTFILMVIFCKNNLSRSVLFIWLPSIQPILFKCRKYTVFIKALNLKLNLFFWKPLFKKTSYFGFFKSSRFISKNIFNKNAK